MKKTMIVSAFLCVCMFANSQDFEARIVYEATLNDELYRENLISDNTLSQEIKEERLKAASTKTPVNFHLFISGDESLYKAEHDMETKRRLGHKFNLTSVITQEQVIFYTNQKTNEKFYQSFFTKEVLVELDSIDWTLTQETKKIGEYTCYKATATIDNVQLPGMNFLSPVIVWYTPQIPTSFGIQSFNGLPGLTLELIAEYEDGKVFYSATKIELNPKVNVNIRKPKGKKVSESKYIALIEKLNKARKRRS